ncbi:MAG: LytR family transcriptional regulator, partial [Thermoleophilaceae bacterium]|nr:LytR family transcriptional regulator [Thermoleophilaceae bacterium]
KKANGDSGLEKAPGPGKEQAIQAIEQGAGGKLPVYYPTVRLTGSTFPGPARAYRIKASDGKLHKSYRMVIKRGLLGEYYGIQGTTWQDPPILESTSEERTIGKRKFELHYDGDRVRIVAWRTRKAVYWVSNTLLQSLTEGQMLGIARSARLP